MTSVARLPTTMPTLGTWGTSLSGIAHVCSPSFTRAFSRTRGAGAAPCCAPSHAGDTAIATRAASRYRDVSVMIPPYMNEAGVGRPLILRAFPVSAHECELGLSGGPAAPRPEERAVAWTGRRADPDVVFAVRLEHHRREQGQP